MPLPFLPFTDDEIFPIYNLVGAGWLLLAIAPTWRVTGYVVTGLALLYSVVYMGLLADTMLLHPIGATPEAFKSLDGLINLFSNKTAVFAGWVHYLAFDLWVGQWMAVDAASRGVPRLLMGPLLFFTLMLGPSGFGVYYALVRPWFRGGEGRGGHHKAA